MLKEVRDCIIQSDEERLKQLSPYLHSYWRDPHVSSGCVCMDEKVAIPNTLKETCANQHKKLSHVNGSRMTMNLGSFARQKYIEQSHSRVNSQTKHRPKEATEQAFQKEPRWSIRGASPWSRKQTSTHQ